MGQQGNFFPKPQPLSEREAALIVDQAMARAREALRAEPRGPRRPSLARQQRIAGAVAAPRAFGWLRQYPEQAIIGLSLAACLAGWATHPFG